MSQDDSLDGMSDIMCGENFNTLKKGPHWTDFNLKHSSSPIDPPPEFQDKPKFPIIEYFCEKLTVQIIRRALFEYKESELKKIRLINHLHRPLHHLLGRPYFTTEFIPFSPCHIGRPSSRSSLGSSRLSSSHNSLSVPTTQRVDDSTFITQAVSHDTLTSNQISDLYNVPFDSDMYAIPVDVIKPPLKPRRVQQQQLKKKRRNTASGYRDLDVRHSKIMISKKSAKPEKVGKSNFFFNCLTTYHCFCFFQSQAYQNETKRHSLAGTSASSQGEPIHMTLQEVRQYLQTLYSSSSDSSELQEKVYRPKTTILVTNNNKYSINHNTSLVMSKKDASNTHLRSKKNTFLINIKNKKVKDSCDTIGKQINTSPSKKDDKRKKPSAKLFSFKQTLCNMFRFKRFLSPEHVKVESEKTYGSSINIQDDIHNISSRALPPLPMKEEEAEDIDEEQTLDFATSIQRVKDVSIINNNSNRKLVVYIAVL